MTLNRFFQIFLFILSFILCCIVSYILSPPVFSFRFAFYVLSFLIFAITYWTPKTGLWFFLAFIPFANIPSRALELGAHKSIVLLALFFALGWWANKIVVRRKNILQLSIFLPLMFVILIGISSCFWTLLRLVDFYPFKLGVFKNISINSIGTTSAFAIRHSISELITYLVFPVLFISTFNIWQSILNKNKSFQRNLSNVVVIWSIALIPVIITAFYQQIFNPGFCMLTETAWQTSNRISGGMTDPNALGLFLFLFIPLSIVCAIKESGIKQAFLFCMIIPAIYVVTLSGSRSTFLGLILTAIVVSVYYCFHYIFTSKNYKKIAVFAIIIILFSALIIPFLGISIKKSKPSSNPLVKRMQLFVEKINTAPSLRLIDKRELQWKQAVSMWKDFPFVGIGLGAFALELPNYNQKAHDETPIDNAWNQYLNWMAELGLAGIFLWIGFWIAFFISIFSYVKNKGLKIITSQFVVLFTLIIVFLFLNVFGAHFQAPEVSAGVAIISALLFAYYNLESFPLKLPNKRETFIIALIFLIICIAQAQNSLNPLSWKVLRKKYNLPTEFGMYKTENWQNMFEYRWTEKYAGININIPSKNKVAVLRMAAFDPDITPQKPKLVKVWIGNTYLKTLKFTDNNWTDKQIYFYDYSKGEYSLIFECNKIWEPTNEIPPRSLGIAIDSNIRWTNVLNKPEGFLVLKKAEKTKKRNVGIHAAETIKVGEKGIIEFKIRAPANPSFYQSPVKVSIMFNQKLMKKIELPKNCNDWIDVKISTGQNNKNSNGILSLKVNRTSSLRIPGSTKKQKVGVIISEIKSY